MKYADLPRSANRARINQLFNGERPFTAAEQAENKITVNVNFLDATRIAHDARRQYTQAFLKPGNFFSVKVDRGPVHQRTQWSEIITKEINKRLKRSHIYGETLRNVFAQLVLHGVGPVTWANKHDWCPSMHIMGDILIPSRTLRSFENLSHFAIFRRYTAEQLFTATHGPRVDKGWNMDVVNSALKWAAMQRGKSTGSIDNTWSPEKIAEDIKADTGLYASDQVPTIDCWDFYFKDDSSKEYGWKRRIVLDTPAKENVGTKNFLDANNQFLFDPGNRNYANRIGEIIHFQFGDGSVVAPFLYHSIRSLGILLYAVCHLQNRLRCKFNDSVFESLLQYFRVANPDDAARLKQIDLIAYGIIPDGLNFVKAEERWQVNEGLVSTAMGLNRQSMAEQSTSFTQDFGFGEPGKKQDKTATQIAAEVNASNAMVGAMLQEGYTYQTPQYEEISRRFRIPNSRNLDVREFRKACLEQGVPESVLNSDCWNISTERVIGNGNKTVELAQVNLLMQHIDRYDPDAQRIILRTYTFAAVDDPAMADQLVPVEKTMVTDSVHDAQLAAATLLMGLHMGLKQGVNHGEYAATLIGMMHATVQKILARGGVGTAEEIAGLQNIAGMTIAGQNIDGNGAANHIAILSMEKNNAQMVKQLNDLLGDQMNEVKAFAQRLAEQQGETNGQIAPEDAVKLKGQLLIDEARAENIRSTGELKLQQKQEQHALKTQQSIEKHELQMAESIRKAQVEEAALDIKTAGEIWRDAKTE